MTEQLEIEGLKPAPKKRGRKPKHNLVAMDSATRKRDQIARQLEKINNFENDCDTWTEADCLLVLKSANYKPGTALDEAAWKQLGKLRGYL